MMQRGLHDAIDDTSKDAVVASFFGGTGSNTRVGFYARYFDYYEKELKHLRLGIRQSTRPIDELAAKTHGDIVRICTVLKGAHSLPRSEVRKSVRGILFPLEDDLAINRSLDLTVRLWLMINVRDKDLAIRTPHKPSVQWGETDSLHDFIQRQFPSSKFGGTQRHPRLRPSFTVAEMVEICSLDLRWTDSLEDHLRLDMRRRKVLWVFSYKDFLNGHLNSGETLSSELVNETIMTLNMLFPQWDPATQRLLAKHGQVFHDTAPFFGPQRLNLDDFAFWKVRLVEIYEEIYLAPPDSWRQLWVDRRNPHQYYTFWIALIVLGLSLLSCAASILQAWASIRALNLQIAVMSETSR
ncbi:hypothetical protein B0T18DRAFT_420321 [Schizothecium vesticola]|uniref:Uncharacterized protein n=1 Tax=Schizothecium vesticola TaxID=314040 RepID=A0AA40ELI4_9PEZI|nr:hypothetical protein B0T18DRAFT_420321 [Schizothecium vesticola]